jgi:hypothetical protein
MNMEKMIKFYLLIKSARGRVLTRFDIALARVLRETVYGIWWMTPTWLNMIANMERENSLPEAWTDYRLTVAESIREWIEFTFAFSFGGPDDPE